VAFAAHARRARGVARKHTALRKNVNRENLLNAVMETPSLVSRCYTSAAMDFSGRGKYTLGMRLAG
jgi:hypothetical protein